MNRLSMLVIALAGGAILAGGGYYLGKRATASEPMALGAKTPAATPGAQDERKILYWHDPMFPQQKFDKPGKSPFMDMMLVPVYGDGGEDHVGEGQGTVRINPRLAQNLGMRTAPVTLGKMGRQVEAVGTVAFDERTVAVLQARVTGYVDKLYVRAPLDPVRPGQPLAGIDAPEWVAAQEEYLAVLRTTPANDPLRQAARQRLALIGVPERVVAAIDETGQTSPRVTITSPIAGVVTELQAREGMAVQPGTTLFRINGIATVWVNAEVPEMQAGALQPGNAIEARFAAFPGEVFSGKVTAVLPEVSAATRTLKARIELANPGGRLKPGMYARIEFAPQGKEEILLVPSEAVIRTGQREVVIVAEGEGRFRPVDVKTGAEAGGQTEIHKGLKAGDSVVISGQFLIDSEASLKGTLNRMTETPPAEEKGNAPPAPGTKP